MRAMEISLSGLDVEWRRLEVIADNIANANTTAVPGGELYRARRVVSGPRASFGELLQSPGVGGLHGVAVYGTEPVQASPRRVYEPQHPNADKDGFVSYPSVDQAGEMALLVKTARAYEANLVAMNAARQMYSKALEIGRRS